MSNGVSTCGFAHSELLAGHEKLTLWLSFFSAQVPCSCERVSTLSTRTSSGSLVQKQCPSSGVAASFLWWL